MKAMKPMKAMKKFKKTMKPMKAMKKPKKTMKPMKAMKKPKKTMKAMKSMKVTKKQATAAWYALDVEYGFAADPRIDTLNAYFQDKPVEFAYPAQ